MLNLMDQQLDISPRDAIFLERTVVASKCEKVVAGAGSVKSSVVHIQLELNVIEPDFV